MSDAPITGPINLVEEFAAADDFTKKHTPFIDATRDGDTVTVTVAVQRVSTLPLAQLVPSVGDVTVLASVLLPTSGLFTVTE